MSGQCVYCAAIRYYNSESEQMEYTEYNVTDHCHMSDDGEHAMVEV